MYLCVYVCMYVYVFMYVYMYVQDVRPTDEMENSLEKSKGLKVFRE